MAIKNSDFKRYLESRVSPTHNLLLALVSSLGNDDALGFHYITSAEGLVADIESRMATRVQVSPTEKTMRDKIVESICDVLNIQRPRILELKEPDNCFLARGAALLKGELGSHDALDFLPAVLADSSTLNPFIQNLGRQCQTFKSFMQRRSDETAEILAAMEVAKMLAHFKQSTVVSAELIANVLHTNRVLATAWRAIMKTPRNRIEFTEFLERKWKEINDPTKFGAWLIQSSVSEYHSRAAVSRAPDALGHQAQTATPRALERKRAPSPQSTTSAIKNIILSIANSNQDAASALQQLNTEQKHTTSTPNPSHRDGKTIFASDAKMAFDLQVKEIEEYRKARAFRK